MQTFPTEPRVLKTMLINSGKKISTFCTQAHIKFGLTRTWNLTSGSHSIFEQAAGLSSVILLVQIFDYLT